MHSEHAYTHAYTHMRAIMHTHTLPLIRTHAHTRAQHTAKMHDAHSESLALLALVYIVKYAGRGDLLHLVQNSAQVLVQAYKTHKDENTPVGSLGPDVRLCCSVLQRVAACCSVLQRVAACCSVLQRVAVRCSVLQSGRSLGQDGSFLLFAIISYIHL